ncbi:MAG TPA: tRNA (adenosine(37)-N6)-threonylcarbamoyltransferase complex transferase subunit TsaD [Chthonomonadaceae bacterium]|nr:tRNA (adenosine(37)-N6)-threonylcarbamoyltransferase complex transferase subunit TsaD [Chthonomonadaceae bacterium]
MNVLGIESSCDETSAAVVRDGVSILSNVVASQADLHARYGGVVPEVASRMHVEQILPVISDALAAADCDFASIDALAVTNRPGLLGALLVGVTAGKALAFALRRPVVGIHHLEGHIYSVALAAPEILASLPVLVLIVSGGHTQIVRMDGHGAYALLGRTRDDAAGEAFDKGARLLGLPYPGGPNLARLADTGDPARVPFPRAMLGDSLDFSFSGVKTALRSFLAREEGDTPPADLAASYQAAIVSVLSEKLKRAARATGVRTVAVAGGVAANAALGRALRAMADEEGLRLVVPPRDLCTDNAAMIASAGFFRLEGGAVPSLDFDTFATETLGSPAGAQAG